ncbi:MAG: CDP-diacylglycerol diphosphatase [Roseiarcus sp.]|jgi:CDP-diacylglycerol pyrophosphatase
MSMKHMGLVRSAVIPAAALFALLVTPARADRNQLWMIVSLKCMRHLAKSEAPIPCDGIDMSMGWDKGVALLKDGVGKVRMLAIPTHVISGIEDPAVLAAGEPNYFAEAWAARNGFPLRLHARLSSQAVAAVVDSRPARSQDQLHVIVDCLDADVAATLAKEAGDMPTQWRQMPDSLKGRTYWARRVEASKPEDIWPFRLLADGLPEASRDMAAWSLALTKPASLGEGSFLLLADRADGDQGGRARDLLDPACGIAQR